MSTELVVYSPTLPTALPELVNAPELTWQDVVDSLLRGRKPSTLRAYDQALKDFARFVSAPSSAEAIRILLSRPHGMANALAMAYRAHLSDRGLKSATIGLRLSALRAAVTMGRTLGKITWSLDLKNPKIIPYRDMRGPGEGGWYLMLGWAKTAAEGGNHLAIRDLAILRALHDLAMRRGELVSLDLGSIDLEAGVLEVIGKGHTDAIRLSLPVPTRAAIADWIAVRGNEPGPLFTRLDRADPRSGRLTGKSVYMMIAALGRKAGVKRAVKPHGLRHQAITSALDKSNGNLRTVQGYSRHADPRTLMRYDDARVDSAGEIARLVAGE